MSALPAVQPFVLLGNQAQWSACPTAATDSSPMRLLVPCFGFRAIALALLALCGAAASASAQSFPDTVRSLPKPTGPNAVGTTVAYLTDRARKDAAFADGRPITLQLWYPASRGTGATAPYLVEPGLGAALRRMEYAAPSALASWDTLQTHAISDGPVNAGSHPLLTLSVGLGGIRANYTTIATELASHGYIVTLVESPFAGVMVRPGGVEVVDTTQRLGTPGDHRKEVRRWTADISFALDALRPGMPNAAGRVASTIDWARVGALGHSSGGLVAMAACEADTRVKACINMDGGLASPQQEPIADLATTGITKPTMFLRIQPLYSDADFARRGLTREAWEKRGEPGRIAFAAFANRSRGPLWTASIAGTGHSSFSDMPYVMPSALTRFGGKIIDADRGLQVITTVVRTFFELQLRPSPAATADLGLQIPELTISRSKP